MEKLEGTNIDTEQVLKAVFNTRVAGFLITDSHGKIIMNNGESLRMFGYEQLIGKKIEILIPKHLRKNHVSNRSHFIKNPETRVMGVGRDLVGLTKKGKEFPIEVSLSPLKINNKIYILAIVIDITERKRIESQVIKEKEAAQQYLDALKKSEEKLLIYASELEKRVKERTEELAKTVRKLEKINRKLEKEAKERKRIQAEVITALEAEKELNELKSRFVSMASHEFRTPLSTIKSSASLIQKYNAQSAGKQRRKHIERIKSNVNDLTSILNDFLSLDKLESGKIESTVTKFDLVHFLNNVVDELHQLTKPNQSIIFESSSDQIIINTDKQIIKNILNNLVSNAIKYSNENTSIRVKLNQTKKHIRISVVDQGIGVPESEQGHLFDRFFRASNATNIQGTGLGLNLVERYTNLLNGKITFASTEGQGSEFTVTIPFTG